MPSSSIFFSLSCADCFLPAGAAPAVAATAQDATETIDRLTARDMRAWMSCRTKRAVKYPVFRVVNSPLL